MKVWGGLVRPFIGRLHCGWPQVLGREIGDRVIRPIPGRLHCDACSDAPASR
jgi:hypothetical protein